MPWANAFRAAFKSLAGPWHTGAPLELEQSCGATPGVSVAKHPPANNKQNAAGSHRIVLTIECRAADVLQEEYSEGNYGRNEWPLRGGDFLCFVAPWSRL